MATDPSEHTTVTIKKSRPAGNQFPFQQQQTPVRQPVTTPQATTPKYTSPALKKLYQQQPYNQQQPYYQQPYNQQPKAAAPKAATPAAPTYNWSDELAAAMPGLRSDFDYQMRQRGLDPATTTVGGQPVNWDDVFNQEIQHRLAGMPTGTTAGTDKTALDQAIDQYIRPNVGSSALDDYQTQVRANLRNQVGGQNLENDINTRFGTNAIQGYLDSIYNDQYNAAKQQIENTNKRGEFNAFGYDAANKLLDTQGTAGRATLSDLGQSYLTTDKKTLNDALSGIYDKIGNYTLGQNYDPTADISNLQTQEGTLGGQLQGQITGAAPSLFDTSSIFQKASAQQGATSGGTLSDTLAQRNLDQAKGRGLGSQGAF